MLLLIYYICVHFYVSRKEFEYYSNKRIGLPFSEVFIELVLNQKLIVNHSFKKNLEAFALMLHVYCSLQQEGTAE